MVGYCGGVWRRGDAGGYALCVGLLGLVRSLLVGRLCPAIAVGDRWCVFDLLLGQGGRVTVVKSVDVSR
jgi:hypothetical protein